MACNAAPAIQKQKDRVRDKSSDVQLWKGRRAKGLTRCLMKKKKKSNRRSRLGLSRSGEEQPRVKETDEPFCTPNQPE